MSHDFIPQFSWYGITAPRLHLIEQSSQSDHRKSWYGSRMSHSRTLPVYHILVSYQDMTSWYSTRIWRPGTIHGYNILLQYQDMKYWYCTTIEHPRTVPNQILVSYHDLICLDSGDCLRTWSPEEVEPVFKHLKRVPKYDIFVLYYDVIFQLSTKLVFLSTVTPI